MRAERLWEDRRVPRPAQTDIVSRTSCNAGVMPPKYLRSDLIEPKVQRPDRSSKLDPYAEKLAAWLRRKAGRPRKQRWTVKQLYGDLVSLGYDGSYNRVAAFARFFDIFQISAARTYEPQGAACRAFTAMP